MLIKILIVEDQFIEANNLRRILEKSGYLVLPIARSVEAARKILEADVPDMVMLDIFLKGPLTGIDFAKELREKKIGFLYISANSNKQILDQAKATKPYGFLVKPFREKDVLVMLDVAWYLHDHERSVLAQQSQSIVITAKENGEASLKDIITQSPEMLNIISDVKLVAPLDTSVLILGESGTGKELIARAVHALSSRAGKPFIVVNCGVLPENLIESELFGHERGAFTGAISQRIGKFEQADGGTIFLDEMGELPMGMQVKFLRVLQEHEIERIAGVTRKVDIRVIAATNRDLETEVASDRFRLDLYYRLSVFPVTLPPLRQRREDIVLLANYFLRRFAKEHNRMVIGISADVERDLLAYNWPGNIRELENLIERSVLLSKEAIIQHIHLPKNNAVLVEKDQGMRIRTIEEVERDHIIGVLKICNWKIGGPNGAAEMLKINSSTLKSKIKKLGIENTTHD